MNVIPIIEGLKPDEQQQVSAMLSNWSKALGKNRERTEHYRGNVNVAKLDLGVSVPPPALKKLKRQSIMWCKKVVDTYACASVLNGFRFLGDAPDGFMQVIEENEVIDTYTMASQSELVHCAALWTVTGGGNNEPPVIVNAYDMEHATALWDTRRKRIKCGLAITDVDSKNPKKPTSIIFYAENGDVVESRLTGKGWVSTRTTNGVGRCLMVCMRNDYDLGRPLGRSVLTNSVLEIENRANSEAIKMMMHSEVYSAPTRYILNAPDDLFDKISKWESYYGNILAITPGEDGETPVTGSYPAGDFAPHIQFMRQLANQLAAETMIPVHSLMYTEANPTSSEAINAGEHDMVRKIEMFNTRNGKALREVGLLVASILTRTPYAELPEEVRSLHVDWRNPARPSISANADAWVKYASLAPAIVEGRTFWEQQYLADSTIDRIMADMKRHAGKGVIDSLKGVVVDAPRE